MKYLIFSALYLAVAIPGASVLVRSTPGENLSFRIGEIVGFVLLPLVVGALATIPKWQRFKAFAITTLLLAGLAVAGEIS